MTEDTRVRDLMASIEAQSRRLTLQASLEESRLALLEARLVDLESALAAALAREATDLTRLATLTAAVEAHRPLCPRCRALLDGIPAQPGRPEAQ